MLLLGISLIILKSNTRDSNNTSIISISINLYYRDSTLLLALKIVSLVGSFSISIKTLLGLNRNKLLFFYTIRIFLFISIISFISLYR